MPVLLKDEKGNRINEKQAKHICIRFIPVVTVDVVNDQRNQNHIYEKKGNLVGVSVAYETGLIKDSSGFGQ